MSHKHHGMTANRGIDHVPCSPFSENGRFGRLFPNLPAQEAEDDQLLCLANSMKETADDKKGDDPRIPAGYTFFGQFVDHDITLDVTSSLERTNDPTAIENFRTPALELDSIYGQGPEATPFLYDQDHEGHLLFGTDDNPLDLARNRQGRALIGDPRNDENGIISQMQLLFLRFHNKVFDLVEAGDSPEQYRYHEEAFREAQRIVRWHYQWIVLHDFLPRIVDDKVLEHVHEHGRKCFEWHGFHAFMPIEFAVAAYRFGHSQVRNVYDINDTATDIDLFRQPGDPPGSALPAFMPIPPEFVVDWSRFLDLPGGGPKPQASRTIDTLMAEELFELPFVPGGGDRASLAFRNLLRGKSFDLPSGELVARALGVEVIDTGVDDLCGLESTPLWYYVLREAEETPKNRLGEVGGTIVAETLIGLLEGDPLSFPNLSPAWKPSLPSATAQEFTLADLAAFVEAP